MNDNLEKHILDLHMASARLGVYGDSALREKFEKFTYKRVKISSYVFGIQNRDLTLAYDELKEAESLASEIINSLKKELEN